MAKKYVIALFFLLALCIQVLPIKQIGAMLFGKQVNEEMPHAPEDAKGDTKKNDFSKHDLFLKTDNVYTHHFLIGTNKYLHFASSLPASHAGEIPTPPPDVAA